MVPMLARSFPNLTSLDLDCNRVGSEAAALNQGQSRLLLVRIGEPIERKLKGAPHLSGRDITGLLLDSLGKKSGLLQQERAIQKAERLQSSRRAFAFRCALR